MENRTPGFYKENYIRHLSNYSYWIMPYLRNIQDKYQKSMLLQFDEEIDLKAYCKDERKYLEDAKDLLSKYTN